MYCARPVSPIGQLSQVTRPMFTNMPLSQLRLPLVLIATWVSYTREIAAKRKIWNNRMVQRLTYLLALILNSPLGER
jgi:hypothetical protein